MLWLVVLGSLASADSSEAKDSPSRSDSSFKTEPPSAAPNGFDGGIGGAIFIAFLLGLVGLGASIEGSILYIKPLVDKHRVADSTFEKMDHL